MRIVKEIVLCAALCFAASCSVYREYERPQFEGVELLDSADRAAVATDPVTGEAVLPDTSRLSDISWRDFFTDSLLCSYISLGLENNSDVHIAAARVEEARAAMNMALWAFVPSFDLAPSYSFTNSEERYGWSVNSWSLPLKASWEVDLRGDLVNGHRRARASLEQSEVYLRSVRTGLVSAIADMYYTLLKLDAQLEVSRSTAESWQKNVLIMRNMKDAGMANEASVSQSEANACSIEASLFDLEHQIRSLELQFQVLLGTRLGEVARGRLDEAPLECITASSVPALMLSRRPDVQMAEYDLRKAWYDVAAAHSAFYPSISINAEFGWEKAVTSPAGWLISLGAGALQPLLRHRQIAGSLTIAEQKQLESAETFRKTILSAAGEVRTALSLCLSAEGKTEVRVRQISALESAVYSTEQLMRHGESTYLEVLTAQQSLLSARLLQISDKYESIQGTIALYRALGGGE